jgi:hypothetical protein
MDKIAITSSIISANKHMPWRQRFLSQFDELLIIQIENIQGISIKVGSQCFKH